MKPSEELQQLLRSIDRRGYPAYKDTKGSYSFGSYALSIDHVQGDPFASPSKVSIHVEGKAAGFPQECFQTKERRIALQDYLLRLFKKAVDQFNFKAKGSGKSGLMSVSRCGQEVLERTACGLDPEDGSLILRLEVGFPANGRTICSGELVKILFDFLPRCVQSVLFYRSLDKKEIEGLLCLADDQKYIRDSLGEKGLVAFVANGSILPRESGVSDRPMKGGVPFVSPASMETELCLPHKGTVRGMGIPRGVTLIVGGGYHGKSTLLKALELGVYDHIAGDGREYVITVPDAVKIRAEDGRSVKGDDISLFVNHLPNGKNTVSFDTEDASGSTSQAANVVEAIESGATALLIDEDTSATNFMVRDELMQRVVLREQEPITPFIERAGFLYEKQGISCVIVAGSSGSYFQIADRIVQMDNYEPKEITEFAKAEAKAFPAVSVPKEEPRLPSFARAPHPAGRGACGQTQERANGYDRNRFGRNGGGSGAGGYGRGQSRGNEHNGNEHNGNGGNAYGGNRQGGDWNRQGGGRDRVKIKGMGKEAVSLDKETVDLRYVEQLTDAEQTMALGYLLAYAQANLFNGADSMRKIVDRLLELTGQKGLQAVVPGDYLPSGLAMPRKQEIFACFNRYRSLKL